MRCVLCESPFLRLSSEGRKSDSVETKARRKPWYQLAAGGGEGGGQKQLRVKSRLFPLALHRLPPKGSMRLLVLMVVDEMS